MTSDTDFSKMYDNLKKECESLKIRIKATRNKITEHLKHCCGNYPDSSENGCKGFCESFGCSTLRGIRDALKG